MFSSPYKYEDYLTAMMLVEARKREFEMMFKCAPAPSPESAPRKGILASLVRGLLRQVRVRVRTLRRARRRQGRNKNDVEDAMPVGIATS